MTGEKALCVRNMEIGRRDMVLKSQRRGKMNLGPSFYIGRHYFDISSINIVIIIIIIFGERINNILVILFL